MLVNDWVVMYYVFIGIQGALVCSENLLLCSDSWCNDNTISVDYVKSGTYVQYVCHTDNSNTLTWDVSTAEIRVFIPSDDIGVTQVVDEKFFYTVIDNGGPWWIINIISVI